MAGIKKEMSRETEIATDDLDSLIEYCPESPVCEDDCASNIKNASPLPRIILVCGLCYRQYDLEEDLRGHMIEYHKCVPIDIKKETPERTKQTRAQETQHVMNKETQMPTTNNDVVLEENPPKPMEMKPVPFKDFRLILRKQMTLKCTATPSCLYKFETGTQREKHLNCHLQNANTFKCSICSMSLDNWRKCSAHLWKSHQMDVDLLKCPICEFKSHASALVWRHMRVHKKWRPRVLRSLKAVKEKRLKQMQEASLPRVEETPKTVVRKNKYYSEKICEICERKFVNGKTLSKHIKTVHNKIKPFICNVCGKKTARKASLIIHMRQHTGEKPLQCKSCKFSTRDPSVLHKHQMRHNRDAVKLKCSLCDFSCIQANAYKHHMRLNHVESYKKIACDLCSYVTVNEDKLKAHKEDHRKGLIRNNEEASTRKVHKSNEASTDCFLPLESIDSLPHEPAVDTGGVTIPAPTEDSQFPTYFHTN
ncbi:zinc finger protein Xfin [Stomoxys calcitrans]|uniref:zinc finger protein Xfin n=1 Tax=Stomoxys calcitrans TaxID=35570 RepID=UPI0027E2848F|nr:zinc finger protein Xfin [Stomoxys calcitrans]